MLRDVNTSLVVFKVWATSESRSNFCIASWYLLTQRFKFSRRLQALRKEFECHTDKRKELANYCDKWQSTI